MKVLLPIHEERISAVFDAAKVFVLISIKQEQITFCGKFFLENKDPLVKAQKIIELGVNVLICGAISKYIELVLTSANINVIPNTCGSIDEIISAFAQGRLSSKAFLMPGCKGHRRCMRHQKKNGKLVTFKGG
jgi:predicted Fe-Mo cluster-binding NifX family protein